MAALVAAIQARPADHWMAGSSPAMTVRGRWLIAARHLCATPIKPFEKPSKTAKIVAMFLSKTQYQNRKGHSCSALC
jgi:hypothetical protein